MRRVLWVLIPALVAVLGFMLLSKRYWVRPHTSRGQVLWHNDECFVFMGLDTSGWSGTLATQFVVMRSLALQMKYVRLIREDMIVYRLTGNRVERFSVSGVGLRSIVFPYHGLLYQVVGSREPPRPVWRWNGTTFLRLDDDAARKVLGDVSSSRAQLEAEGWSAYENILIFDGGERSYAIPLADGSVTLTIKKAEAGHVEGGWTKEAVTVIINGPQLAEPFHEVFDQRWKQVSRRGYREISSSRAGVLQ